MNDHSDIDLVEELIRRGVFQEIPPGLGYQFLNDDVKVINRSAVNIFAYVYFQRPDEASEPPDALSI